MKRGDTLTITIRNELEDHSKDGRNGGDGAGVGVGVGSRMIHVNVTNIHLHGMHVAATPYDPTTNTCGDNIKCRVLPGGGTMVFQYQIPSGEKASKCSIGGGR